jgi:hypothetical protein
MNDEMEVKGGSGTKCKLPHITVPVLAHTMIRLQLILFSKIAGAFLFRTFGGYLLVPTTQIYCLTGA